ncbi:MAG: hypothetical protein GXP25_06060 [Planctomycetes bacterium]|nr:hypothetical protein [Planctomycetota bacterium]
MIIDVHQRRYRDNIAEHLARTKTLCRKRRIDGDRACEIASFLVPRLCLGTGRPSGSA